MKDWADVFNWFFERLISLYTAAWILIIIAFNQLLTQDIEGAIFFAVLAIYMRMIADKHDMGLALKKLKNAGFEGVFITPLDENSQASPDKKINQKKGTHE